MVEDLISRLPESARRPLAQMQRLPGVKHVIVYGSYAKGTERPDSDLDVAVFFRDDGSAPLTRYKSLVALCSTPELDIQAQAFSECELQDPCGIVEEIVKYGIECATA